MAASSSRGAAGTPLGRSLRIALLHPTYWPEVRRGSERLIHDLGTSLAERGHDVTLLTSHRGRSTTTIEDGIRVVRSWRAPELPMLRKYEHHVANIPNVVWRLLRSRFDLVHAFFASDAWAAVQARRLGGPPTIFSFHGIPIRRYLVDRRYRMEMTLAAAHGAETTTVLSTAAAESFRKYLLVEPRVVPGGVMYRDFAVDAQRTSAPTLLCAASLGAPNKPAKLLFSAFSSLRRSRPDLRLLIVRTPDPFLTRAIGDLPAGAEFIEANTTGGLARAYGSAWVSVLPSVEEAFGLVLLESLAAGTPVVATRSGGIPEIVDSQRVGCLFEPGDGPALIRAIEEALSLAADPATTAACRDRAAEYDWSRIVLRYEELYASVLDGSRAP